MVEVLNFTTQKIINLVEELPDFLKEKKIVRIEDTLPYLSVEWQDNDCRNQIKSITQYYKSIIIKKVLLQKVFSGAIYKNKYRHEIAATWSFNLGNFDLQANSTSGNQNRNSTNN